MRHKQNLKSSVWVRNFFEPQGNVMGDGVAAVVVVDVKGEGRVVVDNMDYIIAVIVVVMADGAAVVDVMADAWCVVKLCKNFTL